MEERLLCLWSARDGKSTSADHLIDKDYARVRLRYVHLTALECLFFEDFCML
jgi:hypothetical protein